MQIMQKKNYACYLYKLQCSNMSYKQLTKTVFIITVKKMDNFNNK